MRKKKIIIFDRYSHKPGESYRRQIQQIQDALMSEGYSSNVISHKDAKDMLRSNKDPTAGHGGYIDTGANTSGERNGDYVKVADELDYALAKSKKPGVHICRSAQGLSEIISGEDTIDTGEWNRKTDEDGRVFNHKFGALAKGLRGKVKNLETINHGGYELARGYTIDNKLAAQDHLERSKEGAKIIGAHFNEHLGYKK